MSGIIALVALGAQDEFLVSNPSVSFWRSQYKRHTGFSTSVQRQVVQGNPVSNGTSTIRIEKAGDMLSYVYLTRKSSAGQVQTIANAEISKVELFIGGQKIDSQDSTFSQGVWQEYFANTSAKSSGSPNFAYPLHLFFCDDYSAALPLVAMQFHDVEIRITWGTIGAGSYEAWCNYVFLDNDEREWFSDNPHNLLVTQTQEQLSSVKRVQTFDFSHPVKAIVSSAASTAMTSGGAPRTETLKIQYNGTEIGEPKTITPHFDEIPVYEHTMFGSLAGTERICLSYALNMSKYQPQGTLNYSRLDSAVLTLSSGNFVASEKWYAVNYNILKIENGMAGLLFSS